jgi:outer membrane lipase/esterase
MTPKKAAVAVAWLLCLAQEAHAQSFNQLISFGDSTNDTGFFANASTGNETLNALIKSSLAAGGNAHFTGPGLNNTQILGSFFGLPANPANTPGGTNFAVGGALNGNTPIPNVTPNPNVPSTATQISNYLASVNGHANPNALYVISSGGNDYGAIAAGMSGMLSAAAQGGLILSEAQALANGVAQLQEAGGRYIIVANQSATINPSNGLPIYNPAIFSATWADLAAAGVKFIPADTASVINAVLADPLAFGFTAPITSFACVPPPNLTSPANGGAVCAPTTTPSTLHGFLVSPDATQTHMFVDGTHLTEAGQVIIADYYYNLLVAPSEISLLAETAIQTTLQTINGIQQQIDLTGRLRPVGFNVWMNGGLSSLKFDNSAPGFPNASAWPVSGTVGFDYKWLSGWLVGAALTAGYANPTFSLGGGFTQNLGSLSAYTAYYNNNFWGNLIGTVGFLSDQTNRNVPIGITVQSNMGSTTGYDPSLAGEVGYDFHAGPITHGPVGGFIVQEAVINGFTESGSFTSLSFDQQTRDSEISVLGYQARYDWGIWHPFAQVLWDHEFDPLDRMVTASLTTTAAPSYSMPAVELGRDWATTTVGTEITFTPAWSALASFTAQVGAQRAPIYNFLIGLNYAFGPAPGLPIIAKD